MSAAAAIYADVQVTLATTCTQIVPGAGVRTVWFSCATACYLVFSDALVDGDALPASRGFLIPANVVKPISVRGRKMFIAASSGAPVGHIYGVED